MAPSVNHVSGVSLDSPPAVVKAELKVSEHWSLFREAAHPLRRGTKLESELAVSRRDFCSFSASPFRLPGKELRSQGLAWSAKAPKSGEVSDGARLDGDIEKSTTDL